MMNQKLLGRKFRPKKIETCGGRYKNSRVFTEQGVAMLATILKSKTAINVSIQIMDAFVAMRKYISNNLIESKRYFDTLIDHETRIKFLEKTFSKFDTKNNELFFEGQIYECAQIRDNNLAGESPA